MSTVLLDQPATSSALPVGPAPEGYIRVGTAALYVALVTGYGAYDQLYDLKPTYAAALIGAGGVATLLLAPRGATGRMVIPLWATAFVAWWVLSYTWSVWQQGFVIASQRELATLFTMVAVANVLPLRWVIRAIIRAGYICIALIVVALVLHPHLAYGSGASAAVPGLRGGFGHKNFMAPTLLFTAAAVLCFERRRAVRLGVVTLVFLLVLAGRSTTGLAALILMLATNWMTVHLADIRRALGRAFGVVMTVGVVIAAAVMAAIMLLLVEESGKDLTFSGRAQIWAGVVDAIQGRPWHGWGWGGVFVNFAIEPTLSINRPLGYSVFHSHDAALELLLRIGVIGLVLYLGVLISALRVGARLANAGHPFGRMVLMFGVVVVVFGFAEVVTVLGVWFALTVVFSSRRLLRRSRVDGSELERW